MSENGGNADMEAGDDPDNTTMPALETTPSAPLTIYDAIYNEPDDDMHQDDDSVLGRLLSDGADPNCFSTSKPTPLFCAVSLGKLGAVKKLLKFGADPNISGHTEAPIIIAACRNSYKIVDVLLLYNADINAVDGLGYSSLHRASGFGHEETVDRLLQCEGIDINLRTLNHQASAVNLASAANSLNVMLSLIGHGCEVNTLDILHNTPLHYMAINGCLAGVEALLLAGAHPDPANQACATPLWNGVYHEQTEVCRRLLQCEGVNLSTESIGVERGRGSRQNMVFNIYHRPVSLLWVAVERQNADLVYLLLDAGLSIHKESWILSQYWTTRNKDERLQDYLLHAIYRPTTLKILCKLAVLKLYGRNLSKLQASVKLPTVLRNYLLP